MSLKDKVLTGLILAISIPLVLPIVAVVLLALPFVWSHDVWLRWSLRRRWERIWGLRGKRVLFVYSNSPHWQAYIEDHWLPLLAQEAVILNWSERATWATHHPFESKIFHYYAGALEYNPVAICFRPHAAPLVVRFWQAFRDYKHGKATTLRSAEAELGAFLGVPVPRVGS